MTYDFFASLTDQLPILEFIFKETDLRVYDLSSHFGEQIIEYTEPEAIIEKIKREKSLATFQLWSSLFAGGVIFRKVELNPQYCNGHTFRYSTDGLGLIQLYLGVQNNEKISKSHIGHFNEKRARLWEDHHLIKADEWNWKEIEKASGKLKYHIQKQSIIKKNGYDILTGATDLECTIG